jgi:RNA polymerase sporulation-specific sigma factor
MELEQIIRLNEKLIYKISSKFFDVPKEDLYQAGVIGIIKAYKNYKQDSTTKFSTYAYNYIYGEMYELANNLRSIKLSKDVLKIYKQIERTKYLLAQQLNRIPSIQEISSYLQIDELLINQIINSTNQIMSLDEDEKRPLYETVSTETKIPQSQIIDIKDSINTLDDCEKEIIKYRYFKDYTQSETAKILGISQVKVSRYEKKSLTKMYNYLNI